MDSWKPTAIIANLRKRSIIINKIRQFFADREVLEVDTPLLCSASVTDPHIDSFLTELYAPGKQQPRTMYLQTSPEYAMKRLLAAGSGPIYQLSKAFRNEESGRMHNSEFTMLEWYRLGFDHHDLMNEMDELLQYVLQTQKAERLSYRAVFEKYCDINPHQVLDKDLLICLEKNNIDYVPSSVDNADTYLHLLMSHVIEPQLGLTRPTFIYDYPVSQAALAKIRQVDVPVAERFEVYVRGVELANGFHELLDAAEQAHRFKRDLRVRQELGLQAMPLDQYFLAALDYGLPACAGVALGVDRLVMLALGVDSIDEVLAFPVSRA